MIDLNTRLATVNTKGFIVEIYPNEYGDGIVLIANCSLTVTPVSANVLAVEPDEMKETK